MNYKEHKERHTKLHRSLDELAADFITHTGKRPSNSTLLEFMEWSAQQMENPATAKEECKSIADCAEGSNG